MADVIRRALSDAEIAAALQTAADALVARRYQPPAEYPVDHARRALMKEFMLRHHRVICRGDVLAASRMTADFVGHLGVFLEAEE